MHLHLHSRAQVRHADSEHTRASLKGRMSQRRLEALLESLESTVRRLSWNPGSTPWASYGDQSSYSDTPDNATSKQLVAEYLTQVPTPGFRMGPWRKRWHLQPNCRRPTMFPVGVDR